MSRRRGSHCDTAAELLKHTSDAAGHTWRMEASSDPAPTPPVNPQYAAGLSPTPRTELGRHRDRARSDRSELFAVLDAALICHLGVSLDGHTRVVPTVFATDPDGPDLGGTLYLHGSVAASSLLAAPDQDVCVTCTSLDGLVLARSAFHHSMNYRSAVVIGRGRLVSDEAEKQRALGLIVDHVVPARSHTLRATTRKELAATVVIAVPLHEASVKTRSGDPVDEDADVASGAWAGVVPLSIRADAVRTAADAAGVAVPAHVCARAEALR